jgi:hypothetical protein
VKHCGQRTAPSPAPIALSHFGQEEPAHFDVAVVGRSEIAAVVSLIEPEMTVPQRLANPRRGTR